MNCAGRARGHADGAAGQRIVYLLNPHVGHLGIFVSAMVARLEHRAILESVGEFESLQPVSTKCRSSIRPVTPTAGGGVVERERTECRHIRQSGAERACHRRLFRLSAAP
ncbi:DUF3141 domain-containing protein [Marinobacterium rhizophilum]|uniref:DUF3141 domain-containing protein n=1 Tax=Marinobacterium rhizophilum TaxID=420402 RepID=UPI0023E460F5|nr:DUF3141 domain-containing protein [Marinobacterium rhizophilum]